MLNFPDAAVSYQNLGPSIKQFFLNKRNSFHIEGKDVTVSHKKGTVVATFSVPPKVAAHLCGSPG